MPSRFIAAHHGGAATEYALILGVLAIGIAAAFAKLPPKLMTTLNALAF